MTIIECKDLTMGYGGQIAFRNLSFKVQQGDYLAIVGENGSGKSTLVKGLLGLITPKSGEIRLCGVRRSQIGYLPQQTATQRDFPASVWEVVLSGCLGQGGYLPWYCASQKARAEKALEQLGVAQLKKRSFRELSGGQRQRVLIARALCAADKLLLLDEPAAALDPAASAELYDIVEHLNKMHGVTLISVLHDMRAVRRAGKILHMAQNDAFFGTAKEYYDSEWSKRFREGESDD